MFGKLIAWALGLKSFEDIKKEDNLNSFKALQKAMYDKELQRQEKIRNDKVCEEARILKLQRGIK